MHTQHVLCIHIYMYKLSMSIYASRRCNIPGQQRGKLDGKQNAKGNIVMACIVYSRQGQKFRQYFNFV